MRQPSCELPVSHHRQSGFTLIQIAIVVAVIMIVSAFAVISIKAARRSLELSNSAHQFAGYMERARADSVRRRATSGLESSVRILSNRTYRVTMGFGGSSSLSSRDFTLDGDVIFTTTPTTVSFDWRGRPHPFLSPTYDMNGGGNSTTGYDSNEVNRALSAAGLRNMGIREY